MQVNLLHRLIWPALIVLILSACRDMPAPDAEYNNIDKMLDQMTLSEKIGQLQLVHSAGGSQTEELAASIRDGLTGAVLNEARPEVIRELQRIAVEESRLGIPLLFGRDVIHGFKTIFPVNIGLAATFNPDIVEQGAVVAAREAKSVGINWNFAPMVDISRDPRWGRMAESFGEDPLLVTTMGLAMFRGFSSDHTGQDFKMAACAKHFAAYGAAEGGRDYNTTSVPQIELWNTYFPPFKALKDAGIQSFMTGFNELNGIPASGNSYLFREILKQQWQFDGFVVSDWASVEEMITHGYAADQKEAALKAIQAGVDLEMATTTYTQYLEELVAEGKADLSLLNDAVRRILKIKYDMGLFEHPFSNKKEVITTPPASHLNLAKESAIQSLVLLKNENDLLPISESTSKISIIGPMAHDRYEQLGTWIFDADTTLGITPLEAFSELLGSSRVHYAKGLPTTRSFSRDGFADAVKAARKSEVIIFFAGEESIITGEAHSRAFLNLPGAQDELIKALAETGKPLVLVVMTPRPLAIGEISEYADAVLYAWHPGTMAGPAIAEVLLGRRSPSGKLPVTFPKTPGQIPIYYAHKNTGRPATKESFVHIDDIPVRSFQTSLGNTSHYLDIGFEPLFPFGFGLSYTTFQYSDLAIANKEISREDTLHISVRLLNTGNFDADEVVQLYIRDKVASVTRPVKELKAFQRVYLKSGSSMMIEFDLPAAQLGFYDQEGQYIIEAGDHQLWIGGSSKAQLTEEFKIIE